MKIQPKIMLSHLTGLVTVTLVCLSIIIGLGFTRDDRRQLHTSYEQLRNINLVAVGANSLSAQIAKDTRLSSRAPGTTLGVKARDRSRL